MQLFEALLEAEVRREACLSVRSEAGARQAVVRWCPRNERLVRELRRLELEFSSDPDQAAFRAFIQGTSPRYTPPNSLQLGQLRLNPPGLGSKCGKRVERLSDF